MHTKSIRTALHIFHKFTKHSICCTLQCMFVYLADVGPDCAHSEIRISYQIECNTLSWCITVHEVSRVFIWFKHAMKFVEHFIF